MDSLGLLSLDPLEQSETYTSLVSSIDQALDDEYTRDIEPSVPLSASKFSLSPVVSYDDDRSIHSAEITRLKTKREAAREKYEKIRKQTKKFSHLPERRTDHNRRGINHHEFDASTQRSHNESLSAKVANNASSSCSMENSSNFLGERSQSSQQTYVELASEDESFTLEVPNSLSRSPSSLSFATASTGTCSRSRNYRDLAAQSFDSSLVSDNNIENIYQSSDLETSSRNSRNMLQQRSNQSNEKDSPSFAQEHKIFVQAILQLLTERDQGSTTIGGIKTVTNRVMKFGTLKKISHFTIGTWKNKMVELREGRLSYHEDNGDPNDWTHMKTIPLRASICSCKATFIPFLMGSSYVFELTVDGGPKRYWMASSELERDEWIESINNAMMEPSAISNLDKKEMNGSLFRIRSAKQRTLVQSKTQLSSSPNKTDLDLYLEVQRLVKDASSKGEYIEALSNIDGKTLNIPIKWIKESMALDNQFAGAFGEEPIEVCVEQLWKDIMRDTVLINGQLFSGDSSHGPEKIVGHLTRLILELDKVATMEEVDGKAIEHMRNFCINESEAVFYARDTLLSSNRTKSGGHTYYGVSTLCNNTELVAMVPNTLEAEPLKLTLKKIGQQRRHKDEDDETDINPQKGENKDEHSKRGFLSHIIPFLRNIGYKIEPSENSTRVDDMEDVKERMTVEILVHVSSEYKICTVDPSGDVEQDTWGMVKASFLQTVSIGGGQNGGIRRGDETIQFSVSTYNAMV